jgi:hypothetical protein
MCSISSASLAEVCQAIEELAARSGAWGGAGAGAGAGAGGGAGHGDRADNAAGRPTGGRSPVTLPGDCADDDITSRVAEAWAMIADANPEVARRVPGYLKAAE